MRLPFIVNQETNCWEWQGVKDKDGYGRWSNGKWGSKEQRAFRTHRLAYLMRYGELPDGKSVLHKCNNPACVNWEHLYVGDHVQNMKDRKESGHYFQGEDNPQCCYGNDVVLEIMRCVEEADLSLAKRLKTSRSFVSRVKLGKTRTKITGGPLIQPRNKGQRKAVTVTRL